MNKQELRKEFMARRGNITAGVKKEYDAAICRYISDMPEFKEAKLVTAYNAFGSEADLGEIVFKSGKNVVLPVCMDDGTLAFKSVKTAGDLAEGKYRGLFEPSKNLPDVDLNDIDLIFVPGLVFDKRGYRIGYGKGYYDKVLDMLSPNCKIFGVAYSLQIVDRLENEPHDKNVGAIVTEEGIIECIKKKYI